MVARFLPGVALLVLLAVQPARAETLVMVSPPAELDAAVRASLAPWRVKIIVVEMASGTPAELALSQGAGFVVWRDRDQLVLWDARAAAGERRGIPSTLDDAGAAALALSIKTWMHLGAPPPPDRGGGRAGADGADPGLPGDAATGDGGSIRVTLPGGAPPRPRVRVEAATGARSNTGGGGRTAMRAAIGVAVGIGTRVGPFELAGTVELGPGVPAGDASMDGALGTTAVSAHARWILTLGGSLSLAPFAGVVAVRTSFDGTDAMDRAFSAGATRPGLDAGAILDWRWRRLLVSAEIGATAVPSQHLQDRNIKLDTSTHIEPRGLVRIGVVVW